MRLDGRTLAAGAVVLAVVVAAAVPASGVLTEGLVLEGASLRAVRIGGVLAILAGAIGLVMQRSRIIRDDPRRGDPSAAGLGIAGGLIVVLALVGLMNPPTPMERSGMVFGLGGGPEYGRGTPLPGNPQEDVTDGGDSMGRGERMEPDMLPGVQNAGEEEEPALQRIGRRIATSILLLLAALAVWRLLARTLGLGLTTADALEEEEEVRTGAGVPPPTDHHAQLDGLLAQLRGGTGTPSRTVQLAYEALLAALAALGAERESQEAPHEHLRRTIGGVGLSRTEPHRLAGLHVADRFGAFPVTDADGRDARTALERILGELRDRLEAARRAPPGVAATATAGTPTVVGTTEPPA